MMSGFVSPTLISFLEHFKRVVVRLLASAVVALELTAVAIVLVAALH